MNQESGQLFERVSSIVEYAKENAVRAVNHSILIANWLIGKEIVEAFQKGEERAEYGDKLIADLSRQLNKAYGRGYSIASLKNFRQFFVAFKDRQIGYPSGSQLEDGQKSYPPGSQSQSDTKHPTASKDEVRVFKPNLSWSHYRALMRV